MNHFASLTALALALVASGSPATAADLRTLHLLTQPEFQRLVKDLAGASALKGLAPAAPLGATGLGLSASTIFTQLEYPLVWRKASDGQGIFTEAVGANVRVSMGLPMGIDLGVVYGGIANAGANIAGAELRWAVLPGAGLLPAVGLRVATSRLSGIDQLRLSNTSYDLTVSKSFGSFTPYLSVGRVETDASPRDAGELGRVKVGQRRVALGGRANFGAVDLAVEADLTGKTHSGSGRLGVRF